MLVRLNNFLSRVEWRWSLWNLVQGTGLLASFALPAWGAWAARLFEDYAPFSWIAAGLIGALIATIVYALYAFARRRLQIIKFQSVVAAGSFINPLDRTFERRRIRIVDLSPPVGGVIKDRTFVDCDLIGPANLFFFGCTFNTNSGESVDGIILKDSARPKNGFGFVNCNFSGCKFYIVTFLVPERDYESFSRHNWQNINWISDVPSPVLPLAATSDST